MAEEGWSNPLPKLKKFKFHENGELYRDSEYSDYEVYDYQTDKPDKYMHIEPYYASYKTLVQLSIVAVIGRLGQQFVYRNPAFRGNPETESLRYIFCLIWIIFCYIIVGLAVFEVGYYAYHEK